MWLAWDTRLSTPNDKGITQRAQLQALAERPRVTKFTVQAQKDLAPPVEFPEELAYLERIARDVAGRAPIGMNGRERVTNTEMLAHVRLYDLDLLPHEIAAIMHCTDILVFGAARPTKKQETPPDERPVPKSRRRLVQ